MNLMIGCCEKLAELCFSVDRLNYACGLFVCSRFESSLCCKSSLVQSVINLSVASTNTPFSRMAYDQCHKQNNKEIKSSSGYINLINNEDKDFLRKMEICSPEFDTYLKEYEDQDFVKAGTPKHKEQYNSFIKNFLLDCKKLYGSFALKGTMHMFLKVCEHVML